MNLMRSGCTQRFRDSDNDMLQEWASIPTAPIDLLPTCNMVTNIRGCTGRYRAKRTSAPSHQTKPDNEQRLLSLARIEQCQVTRSREERLSHMHCDAPMMVALAESVSCERHALGMHTAFPALRQ